jgi:phosphatidylglycerol:prolipoprotein diacylglycerol transferase
MHPILFDLGPLTIHSYGVLLAAAYLLGLQLALIRARRQGLDRQRVMDPGIWIILSALAGAKLLLLIVDFRQFTGSTRAFLGLLQSGGVFYGGLIAAVVVALWYMRRHRMPLWTTTDVFAPGIALGHVVGRLGCLMAGCCFGRPASVPWAITFTDPSSVVASAQLLGVPLHPTQLYEAATEAVILGVLLYGTSRFVIEFYRGDARGLVFGVLSTSQFVSVVIVPLAIVMLLLLGRRGGSAPHAAAQQAAA